MAILIASLTACEYVIVRVGAAVTTVDASK
jgi:hypothetical protein